MGDATAGCGTVHGLFDGVDTWTVRGKVFGKAFVSGDEMVGPTAFGKVRDSTGEMETQIWRVHMTVEDIECGKVLCIYDKMGPRKIRGKVCGTVSGILHDLADEMETNNCRVRVTGEMMVGEKIK